MGERAEAYGRNRTWPGGLEEDVSRQDNSSSLMLRRNYHVASQKLELHKSNWIEARTAGQGPAMDSTAAAEPVARTGLSDTT